MSDITDDFKDTIEKLNKFILENYTKAKTQQLMAEFQILYNDYFTEYLKIKGDKSLMEMSKLIESLSETSKEEKKIILDWMLGNINYIVAKSPNNSN